MGGFAIRTEGWEFGRGGKQDSKSIHPPMESVRSIFSVRCDCTVNSAASIQPCSPAGFSHHSAPSCPLCLALENRALSPLPLPNPASNSPMLQWASIESWIRTALHCLPSLAFCQEPSQLWKSCTSPEPNLFSLPCFFSCSPPSSILSFLLPARLFSLCQRACEYLPMHWH